ncbi:MAG: hypothetical protein LQ338_001083 [Usnochroma carphineum]|nr:MAG: hypothetical protein LQ338_001083 [Usnochroma carphineum]
MGRKNKKVQKATPGGKRTAAGTKSKSITQPLQSLETGPKVGEDKSYGELSRALSPAPSADFDPRPAKRLKTDVGNSIPSIPTTEASTTQDQLHTLSGDAHVTATSSSLPAEVQHLAGQYDFSTMSVISSSKINHKVKALIDRVEKFTFADVNAKPGVVILEAKAEVASKMISIVEIAKGDIAKRGSKWYQYSELRSELLHVKPKQKQRPQGGRTLADVENHEASKGSMDAGVDPPMNETTSDQMEVDDDDSEDGEVAFEIMQPPPGGAVVKERPKVRAVPIMTIYFSRVPVPGLEESYG